MTIPARPLHAEVTQHGSMTVIKVHGSARILDQQVVDKWLTDAGLDRDGQVLMDLSDLDSVWAVTVAVLVAAYCRCHDCGRRVGVIVVQPDMAELLCRHGLSEVMSMYLSVDEAVVEGEAVAEHGQALPLDGPRIGVADEDGRRVVNVRVRKPVKQPSRSAVPEASPGRHRS